MLHKPEHKPPGTRQRRFRQIAKSQRIIQKMKTNVVRSQTTHKQLGSTSSSPPQLKNNNFQGWSGKCWETNSIRSFNWQSKYNSTQCP